MKRILSLFMAAAIVFSNGLLTVSGEEGINIAHNENDAKAEETAQLPSANPQQPLSLGSSSEKSAQTAAEMQTFGAIPEDQLYNIFKNPPAEKKSRPLWFWNSKGKNLNNITKEGIKDIMEKSVEESHYAGFGILPNYLDRYLEDAYYLELYGYALELAQQLGIKMCLYDENGYPSGMAGGLYDERFPETTLKRLDKVEVDFTGPDEAVVAIPVGEHSNYIGAVAMNTETTEIVDISDNAIFADPNLRVPGVYASSDYSADYNSAKAFDGNPDTRWNAGGNNHEWLEICFEAPTTINKVVINEHLGRIGSFEIQYYDGSNWTTNYTGTNVGNNTARSFDVQPTTSSRFRLLITQSSDMPTIWELEFWNDSVKHPIPTGGPTGDRVEWSVPDGEWKVMTFATVKAGGVHGRGVVVDYLDKEAVDNFIDLTYQTYYDNFSEYFGTVIDSAFYDEPLLYEAGGRTWTPNFNSKFEEEHGYDPITYYPALWYDIGEDTAHARNALFGFRTELFSTAYIKSMNDWCADHGLEVMTGHMDQEEIVNPVLITGDLMKIFSHQSAPGIDEVFSYDRAIKAYKIVSSAANNWDKELVMTETFGGFGNTVPMEVLYKDVLNQYTRGVNYIVPHAIWYDDDYNVPDSDFAHPPELSYRDPLYGSQLPAFNEFVGRMSVLTQGGRHVSDIGVLYPINTLQAGTVFDVGNPSMGGVIPEEADYMELGYQLSSFIRKDFTYLHPEVVVDRGSVENGVFRLNNDVNFEEYKVIIMPGAKTISYEALLKIKEFYDGGGQIIATTQLPYMSAEKGMDEGVIEIITQMFDVTREELLPSESLLKYSASSEFNGSYGAERAFDGLASNDSRWNAGDLTFASPQWLEVDFGESIDVNNIVLKENLPYRIGTFKVEAWDGSAWIECASDTIVGASKEISFPDVNTQKIRVYFDPIAKDSISVQELEVYFNASRNLALPPQIDGGSSNGAGGKTIFLGNGYSQNNLKEALDNLENVYDVEIEYLPGYAGGSFSYIHRVVEDRNVYLFANTTDTAISTTVGLRGEITCPMLWNPYDGSATAANYEVVTIAGEKVTNVNISLATAQSVFVVEGIGAPALTAAEVAGLITNIETPLKDSTKLKLPTVPVGFSIHIKSVNPTGIIGLNTVIIPPELGTMVEVVLTVASADASDTADTVVIDVPVPAKTKEHQGEPFTVTIMPVKDGVIRADKTTANVGESVTFTVVPNSGYKVASFTIDGVVKTLNTSGEFVFKGITGDIMVHAIFESILVKVTASAGTGGTIDPDGETLVEKGDSLEFIVIPNSGYKIKTVSANGVPLNSNDGSYLLKNIQSNTIVSASFEESAVDKVGGLVVKEGDGSGRSSSGSSTADKGVFPAKGVTSGRKMSGNNLVAQAMAQLNEAGNKIVTLTVVNQKTVEGKILKELGSLANTADKELVIHADNLTANNKAVASRIYLEPSKLTNLQGEFKLGVATGTRKSNLVLSRFAKWFENEMIIISLEQQGSLEARVHVAVKADLSGLDSDTLYFYNYDSSTNKYTEIIKSDYYLDANGYLHFNTGIGGDILVSSGALVKK